MSNDHLCYAIFPFLARRAQHRRTITYSELGSFIGVHHRDPKLHSALGSIWHWCEKNGYPHINAIVVRKSGAREGLPGPGYTPRGTPISRQDWQQVRDTVYRQDWNATALPHQWPAGYCGN